MALKADRHELDVDISFFMNETAEKGQIVSISTAGSGAAMDQAGALVAIQGATGSVIPVGVLLNDVVNLDLTRQHINWHQRRSPERVAKCRILKKGYVVTNLIAGTPTAGAGLHSCMMTVRLVNIAVPMLEVADGKNTLHDWSFYVHQRTKMAMRR